MVEVPTKNAEAQDAEAISDTMASHFENIKSKIGEITVKMKLQPILAQVVSVGGGTGVGSKRKNVFAIA